MTPETPWPANDMSHDVSRAPSYFATSGRLDIVRRKCVQNEAMGHIVADYVACPTLAGNSVGVLPPSNSNARNILKTNARPALPDHAPADGAGLPSQALKNFAASAFSYFVLGFPFALLLVGVSIWSLFFE